MARHGLKLQICDFCFVSGHVQTAITHSFSNVHNKISTWMNRNSLEFDSNTSSDGESDEIGSLTNTSSPPSNPSDSSLQSSQPNVGHSEQTRALEMRCKALEQKIQEDRARNEDELRRRDEESKGVRET